MSELKNLSAILEGGAVPAGYNGKAIGKLSKTYLKLEIRNFGKMQNRTLEFSDGIQLISGENESGKSTVHTFIRSMLFGMTRGRGRAAKNDVYSRYEPWENPAYYAGEMVLESG